MFGRHYRTLTALSPIEQVLTTPDGTTLYVERFPPPEGQARGVLVVLHGFSIHSGFYRDAAGAFARAGLDVTLFDCRGHGRSGGRRGHVRRFSDFQDDLHLVTEAARAAVPGVPVALLGHSHGATIALDYVLAQRSRIDALMLAAPWLALKLKVPLSKRALARAVGTVWPTFAHNNLLRASESARDPAAQARLTQDPLVHHVATPRWFNEVRSAQAHILDRATTLQVPTFMAVSGEDRIVSSDASLAFARAAGRIVDVRVYEQAFHELFLEPNWPDIVEDFASWLVARLPAPYT